MGLFDNIGTPASTNAPQQSGNRTVDVTFARLPENFAEFASLPQAALANPFDTAALTVLALCFYPQDKEASSFCATVFRRQTMCRAVTLSVLPPITTTSPPSLTL